MTTPPETEQLFEANPSLSLQPQTQDQELDYEAFMALSERERHSTPPPRLPYEIKQLVRHTRWKAIRHGVRSNTFLTGFRLNASAGAFPVEWEDDEAETPLRTYLVKNLLPLTGVVLLSGPSGAGKSFVAIDLAGSLATGFPFFGERVKRGGTLILASEAYGTQHERLKAYRRGKLGWDYEYAMRNGEAPPYPPKFPIAVAPIDNISKINVDAIIATCKEINEEMIENYFVPLRLIIIDTLAAASGMEDENSSTEATSVMKLLQRIAAELNVIVMPVVHHGKSELSGVRGSSAFEASADARLTVQYTKDLDGKVSGRTLSLGKSRNDETGWCHTFDLEKHTLGVDDDGDEITSCYVVDCGEPEEKSSKAKKNPTAKHRENLLAALDYVNATVGTTDTNDGWALVSAVRAKFAEIEGKAMSDAFRKQCERAETDAEADGKIEFMGQRGDKKMRRKEVAEWKSGHWTGTPP